MNGKFFDNAGEDPSPYLGGSQSANGEKRFKKPLLLAGNVESFRHTIYACPYEHTYDSFSVQSPETGSEILVTANNLLLPRRVLRFHLGTPHFRQFQYLIYQHFNKNRSAEFHVVIARLFRDLDMSASFYTHGPDTAGLALFYSAMSHHLGLIDPNWEVAANYMEDKLASSSQRWDRKEVEGAVEKIRLLKYVPDDLTGPHIDAYRAQVLREFQMESRSRDQRIFNQYKERIITNDKLSRTRIITLGSASETGWPEEKPSQPTGQGNRRNHLFEHGMASDPRELEGLARDLRFTLERGRSDNCQSASRIARSVRISRIRSGDHAEDNRLDCKVDSGVIEGGGSSPTAISLESIPSEREASTITPPIESAEPLEMEIDI